MHYKNGREAKVGDLVVGHNANGKLVAGAIVDASPGATSCNIYVGVPEVHVGKAPYKGHYYASAGYVEKDPTYTRMEIGIGTASNFLHAEDVFAAATL